MVAYIKNIRFFTFNIAKNTINKRAVRDFRNLMWNICKLICNMRRKVARNCRLI